jgi:carbon monoxide dehydrogenase subunit G
MVDRSAEEVWKAITDLSNFRLLDPYCLDAKQTSVGPFGVGTTLQLTRSRTPKNPNFLVTEHEPGRKTSMVFTSGPVKGTTQQFSLEAIEGKTKLTRTLDVKYSGFFKLVGPFMTGSLQRQTEEDLGRTKRMLESGAKSQLGSNEPYIIGMA